MATQKINASSRRYTYGFPGAEYPNLESAVSMARHMYAKITQEYGGQIRETFDKALQTEDTSVWLQLTRVVKD